MWLVATILESTSLDSFTNLISFMLLEKILNFKITSIVLLEKLYLTTNQDCK